MERTDSPAGRDRADGPAGRPEAGERPDTGEWPETGGQPEAGERRGAGGRWGGRERPAPAPPTRRRVSLWIKVPGVLLALAAVLLLGTRLFVIPGLGDLFGSETKDRTGPAVLKSLQDMSSYEAAVGNFQVVVDLEKDAKLLPDAIRGTRTLYVGAGTVGGAVSMGGLGKDDVTVNEDRTAATIRLPHATLGKPALDADHSYAVSKQRGLLDRLGDFFSDNPNDERAVHQLAAQRIGEAAKDSGLTARAEKNTTSMLQGLLHSLGFKDVTVTYH